MKIKKALVLIVITIFALFSISYFFSCSKSSPEDFEAYKSKILKLSEKYITLVLDKKYNELYPMMDNKMQKVFKKEQIYSFSDGVVRKFGKPLNFKFKAGGTFKGNYLALITVEHEKAIITYQIAFDKNDKISGFYIKEVKNKENKTTSYKLPSYVNEDKFKKIEIKVGKGKITLNGEITIPKNRDKSPFVLLIHGSGPNDMDETIGPNKIFKDIAYGLSSNNIGVLRYNKITYQYPNNGIDPKKYTAYDLVINDAVNAYKKLISYNFVDKDNIYILGHSLGGILAPLIYDTILKDKNIKTKPKGIILMAGTVENLAKLILRQTKFQANLDGKVNEEEEKAIKKIENDFDKLKQQIKTNKFEKDFTFIWASSFWKSLSNYSELQYLKNSKYPVLILQGLKDSQVFPDIAKSFEKELKNKKNIKFAYFKNLNHLMFKVKGISTGEEYMKPANVSKEVIDSIVKFINSNK